MMSFVAWYYSQDVNNTFKNVWFYSPVHFILKTLLKPSSNMTFVLKVLIKIKNKHLLLVDW